MKPGPLPAPAPPHPPARPRPIPASLIAPGTRALCAQIIHSEHGRARRSRRTMLRRIHQMGKIINGVTALIAITVLLWMMLSTPPENRHRDGWATQQLKSDWSPVP